MDSFSFFVGTRTKTEIYEIMHMHLFGFSVGKVEVPAQPVPRAAGIERHNKIKSLDRRSARRGGGALVAADGASLI